MPKNSTQYMAGYMSTKRREARAAGRCITCCKRKTHAGRSVCGVCAKKATQRTLRRRRAAREVNNLRHSAAAHEQAGDQAREFRLYSEAAVYYRKALETLPLTIDSRLRITEKLAHAYLLGDDPGSAFPLVDWLVRSSRSSPASSEKTIETLLAIAESLWNHMRASQALPILVEAAKIAETTAGSRLRTAVQLRRIRYLHHLERDDEAQSLLAEISGPSVQSNPSLRFSYYREKGRAATILGLKNEAYQNFEYALRAAKKDFDIYNATYVWAQYAHAAKALGDIERSKSCLESALLVAREYRFASRIPYLCLQYASLLATLGQYESARHYVISALAYEDRTRLLETRIAGVGIPIGLRLRDATLVARCEYSGTIAEAFQERNPTHIGIIASAFGRLYISRNDHRRAQSLLSKALQYLYRPDWNWELPIAVAECGSQSSLGPARRLLERRLALPNCDVARACISLFDALVARRTQQMRDMRVHAVNAAERFKVLRWHDYEGTARGLLEPANDKTDSIRHKGEAFGDAIGDAMLGLTAREQQVARLVLRGLTNHAVAKELSISINTVEKHMTVIMQRLGVRSRHQIQGALRIP